MPYTFFSIWSYKCGKHLCLFGLVVSYSLTATCITVNLASPNRKQLEKHAEGRIVLFPMSYTCVTFSYNVKTDYLTPLCICMCRVIKGISCLWSNHKQDTHHHYSYYLVTEKLDSYCHLKYIHGRIKYYFCS